MHNGYTIQESKNSFEQIHSFEKQLSPSSCLRWAGLGHHCQDCSDPDTSIRNTSDTAYNAGSGTSEYVTLCADLIPCNLYAQ